MDEDQWYALSKSQQSAAWKDGYDTARDAYDKVFTELHAEVKALRDEANSDWLNAPPGYDTTAAKAYGRLYAYETVLALIDGER